MCVARFVTNDFADANPSVTYANERFIELFTGVRSNFTAAVGSLTALTSPEEGLKTVLSCPDDQAASPEKNALILSNARALWIVNEIMRLNATSMAKVSFNCIL